MAALLPAVWTPGGVASGAQGGVEGGHPASFLGPTSQARWRAEL